MELSDVINFMHKGAPGALVLMRPADLRGFAEAIKREAVRGALPPGTPIKPKRRDRASIIKALFALFPFTNAAQLAAAIGVSRQAVYKWVDTPTPEDEDEGEGEADGDGATADDLLGALTRADVPGCRQSKIGFDTGQ